MIDRLDTPTKEVLIEARLVELQRNPTTSKGVDWSGTLAAQHVNFGNGSGFFTPPVGATPGSPGVPPSVSSVTSGGGADKLFYKLWLRSDGWNSWPRPGSQWNTFAGNLSDDHGKYEKWI